jgi:hypothetical protein
MVERVWPGSLTRCVHDAQLLGTRTIAFEGRASNGRAVLCPFSTAKLCSTQIEHDKRYAQLAWQQLVQVQQQTESTKQQALRPLEVDGRPGTALPSDHGSSPSPRKRASRQAAFRNR